MQLTQDFRNIVYGPHPRQRLDIYSSCINRAASPVYLWLHGGGYTAGDKYNIPHRLVAQLAIAGISVASANYRFSNDPEFLAPLLDAARIVQFLRLHADEYHLDPGRLAVGGNSAGAVSACWLALGPDRARPDADDPVARQSTRVTCVAVTEAQTTADPRAIRTLLPGPVWKVQSLQILLRLTPEQYDDPEQAALLDSLSFLNWVTPDSPPFFLRNMTPDHPLTDELSPNAAIHHPVFGRALRQQMAPQGIECVLRTREDYPGLDDESAEHRQQDDHAAFLMRHLLAPAKKP